MSRKDRGTLAERIHRAAEAALAAQGQVSVVDVFVGIRWLDPRARRRWQQGQIDCLEEAMQVNSSRISEALQLFRSWADDRRLLASETPYVARTSQRQSLRFSRSGERAVERAYRTHWLSPDLSERKRERLVEKAGKAPELVVILPLNHEWKCHRCGGSGDLLIMEKPGPACLRCVGLDDLEFLPSGDALLTRRVRARSERYAVVVRFSRSRRRYERQGLLVEPEALAAVRRDLSIAN
jgi:hypothetical protein